MQIFFAFVFDISIFKDIPESYSVIGSILIVASIYFNVFKNKTISI